MPNAPLVVSPVPAPLRSSDPAQVVAALRAVYDQQTAWLLAQFAAHRDAGLVRRVRAFYPRLRVDVDGAAAETQRAHSAAGRLRHPGVYEITITRPDLFSHYLMDQISAILQDGAAPIEVSLSDTPIPLPFAAADGLNIGDHFDADDMRALKLQFDLPDLAQIDDRIVNGDLELEPEDPRPLGLFTAPRVDFSLHRLRHYCGSKPEHFQNFVLFTNYQDYILDFIDIARRKVLDPNDDCVALVSPGEQSLAADGTETGEAPRRAPQMPAYHLKRPAGDGVTIVNIGVGPSNAKTITDHIAVLRPDAWLMIGHCAGLRKTQRLGDYVLAHAYVRDDHVLDEDLPIWVPVPALAEVQVALEQAVGQVTGLDPHDRKQIMRTGTVASVDNRNWELLRQRSPNRRLSQSRAIALDMESATIAANGFRMRAPYGALLCVSDKPLHGELKLPGMADAFYRRQVRQHLVIALQAVDNMRRLSVEQLHSRKLRSFDEPLMR